LTRPKSPVKATSAFAALMVITVVGAYAQSPVSCPKALPDGAECWQGKDDNGSYYWIARPRDWNGVLVMHSHGGPRTAAPKPESEIEDLERFAVIVKEGYAFAAPSYREGGYVGIAAAAEDTENLRKIYIARFGAPRRTLAHGQSWGGGVAPHLIERYGAGAGGRPQYDGALLTSGLVAGNATRLRFSRRPARRVPVLLPQPSAIGRTAVSGVDGPARGFEDDVAGARTARERVHRSAHFRREAHRRTGA
jgi:hypothetical protein